MNAPTNLQITYNRNFDAIGNITSTDLTLTWDWDGEKCHSDGFGIFTYTGNTSELHIFDPEQPTWWVAFNKRSCSFIDVNTQKYHHFGVQASKLTENGLNRFKEPVKLPFVEYSEIAVLNSFLIP